MNHSRQAATGALIIPGILGAFLLLSSGFDLIPQLGVFNAKRLLELTVLLTILLTALLSPTVRQSLAGQLGRIPRWAGLFLVLAAGLGIISALRFPHPGYGLADVTMLAVLVISMLVVAACRAAVGGRFDRLAILVIALLGIVVALQEFTGLLAGWSMGIEFSYQQMLIRFAHPRFYNQIQSWTIPALAALPFILGGGPRLKIAAVFLLGLQWCLLLMTGGRGSFASLITALVLLALLVPRLRMSWLRLHLGGVALGFALYAAVLAGHSILAPGGGGFVEQSLGRAMMHTSGRSHLWSLAWEDAVANPWLGAGPMRFDCAGPALHPAHPHNFALQLLAEWGFPATLLILAVCAYLGWALLRRLRLQPGSGDELHIMQTMLGAGVIAAALHACLSGLLIMPASQVTAVLICGWLLGALPATHPQPGTRRRLALLAVITGMVLCLGMLAFSIHEIRHIEMRTEALRMAAPASPRFWQDGRVCLYSYN